VRGSVADGVSWDIHPWVSEGRARVRFGIGLPAGVGDWPAQRDLARAVDALGFDSAWVGDHPSFFADCWTRLAAYAAVTRRIRLVSISCVYYRSPAMLARQAADVDRLSGGRLVLGLAAGWAKGDFDLLGLPFPPPGERARAVAKTIRAVRQLWTNPPTLTSHLDGATLGGPFVVGMVQSPRVPLLITGAGERITLRQVARYADACNVEAIRAPTPADVRCKFELVRRYCAEAGRPADSVVYSHFLSGVALARDRSALARVVDALPPHLRSAANFHACTPSDLVALYRPLIDAGADYLVFSPLNEGVAAARLFAEQVMPELQDYAASKAGIGEV
jgi:alkanesulfonate monooxygenase SsuD/methylene tetrahydromethanopterin reductase-like flavin-dependent oxidoreductase (luciferase family)